MIFTATTLFQIDMNANKLYYLFFLFIITGCTSGGDDNNDANLDYTLIPDPIFEQELIDIQILPPLKDHQSLRFPFQTS